MKLLMLLSGIDRAERQLVLGLYERGVDVAVFHGTNADVGTIAAAGIPCTKWDPRRRFDRRAIATLRKELRTGYDVLHAFRSRQLAVALLALIGLPAPPRVVAYRGSASRMLVPDPLSYLSPRVDRVSCLSNFIRDHLRSQGVPDHRLAQVYKGFDTAWYDEVPPADPPPDIPEDAFVVGTVGHIREQKRADLLLRAVQKLDDPSIHVLLIGKVSDPNVHRIAADPHLQDRVHLTGFRKNAVAWMRRLDVFVMPSRREALCRAVLEALSQGIPTVVSGDGGMKEVVEHETSGLVVPYNDIDALRDAIQRLRDDASLRARFQAAGPERIRSAFSMEAMIEGTLGIYRDVLAQPRS